MGRFDLEEAIAATPALHSGRLYIRTESQLYCFDAKDKKDSLATVGRFNFPQGRSRWQIPAYFAAPGGIPKTVPPQWLTEPNPSTADRT